MKQSPKPEPTTDAVEILRREFIGEDPELVAEYEQTRADLAVARQIHDLRSQAGLTQAQLAKRVGTTQSVIARLEDAEYEGHSLAMLRRIAAALEKRVVIRFVPTAKKTVTRKPVRRLHSVAA